LEQAAKEAEENLKRLKKVWKVINVLDKISSAAEFWTDSADLQWKAKAEWVTLTDWQAIVAVALKNTLTNLVNDNPYDQVVDNVADVIQKIWDKFWSQKIKDFGKAIKENLTISSHINQVIEFAATTDEKTFEDMKSEYDRLYEEETKNAGVLKKWIKFLEYKVVWKAYYRWVRWTSKVIKWVWKLFDKIKSWWS
jgi:hypothetical protein